MMQRRVMAFAHKRRHGPVLHDLRLFSQQSAPQDQPVELLSGFPLLFSTLWRCATRYGVMEMWEDKDLVSSTLSAWEKNRLFLLLNTPARLNFDAEEFLAGAKPALEQLLLATKSRGFAEFVQTPTAGGSPGNQEAAELVKSFCAPRGFIFHEQLIQQSLDRQMIIEAEHVEVESVQLSECVYGQVSESEFDQEMRGIRTVVNEITQDATLERVFVSVKATVNERLRRERIGQEVQVLEQKNVYFAVLASNVTTPDVVDWVFVANVLANTVRSNEISRVDISPPQQQDKPEKEFQ